MGQLPICLDVAGRACLVVGGGAVARRKVDALRDAGARVTVVAPEVDPALAEGPEVVVHRRPFDPQDAQDQALVFACTDDRAVNAAVAAAATAAGGWVNVADDPDACTFFVSAAVHRGPLSIAVGTAGASPALARRIREQLETEFGEAYGPFVELLGQLRAEVVAAEPDETRRRALFAQMAALPCEQIFADGGVDGLERALREVWAPAEARD